MLTFLATRWTLLALAALVNGASVAIAFCETRRGFSTPRSRP